ncbi:MAG: hypothetical protein AVDCRST_MAG25-2452, partial [uncultured Rubrobacteraceae bacterium]
AGGDVRRPRHRKGLLGRARALAPRGGREAGGALGGEGRPGGPDTARNRRAAGALQGRRVRL